MSLRNTIQEDLTSAMKAKDELRVSTLRMLKAAIMKFEVAGDKKIEADDGQVLKLIEKEVKQRKDSIEAFEKGGKTEMAEKEKKEMEILQKYLPEQMSDEELEKVVTQVISQTGATSKADFGKVMGMVMGQTKGRADGTRVKAIVDQKLN
ncbi:MAG: GatB/YqeY domain-containing protein [Patescibacteria group bacterium]